MKSFFCELFSNLTTRSETRLNAKEAYLRAKYQRIQTEEERLKEFKSELDRLITIKCDSCICCCVVELEEDLSKYLDDIIKEYREMDYTVINLREKLEGVHKNYIFLCWDKKY